MENNNLQFKTNLNCSSCVSKVTEDLDQALGANQWAVDTSNSDKVLTVKSEKLTEQEVIDIISKKGFKAEVLSL